MPYLAAFLLLALSAINLWTWLLFRSDKRRARHNLRRVSEAELLFVAAIGGSPAALIARRAFRHKTRKQPFSTWLLLIVLFQAASLAWLVSISLRA